MAVEIFERACAGCGETIVIRAIEEEYYGATFVLNLAGDYWVCDPCKYG